MPALPVEARSEKLLAAPRLRFLLRQDENNRLDSEEKSFLERTKESKELISSDR